VRFGEVRQTVITPAVIAIVVKITIAKICKKERHFMLKGSSSLIKRKCKSIKRR
jgi:hypothetical protein